MKQLALVALLLAGCRHSAAVVHAPIANVGERIQRPAAPPCPAVFRGQARPATPLQCDYQPVYFALDSDQLNPLTQAQLEFLARCSMGALALEGHADERGTEEYNLQLSQRRADVVSRYLAALGARVAGSVGFGESRPVAAGHEELAWEQNRRVEVRVPGP